MEWWSDGQSQYSITPIFRHSDHYAVLAIVESALRPPVSRGAALP
jgi:hypothetical protein